MTDSMSNKKKEVHIDDSVSDLVIQWPVVPFTEVEIAGKEAGLGWGEMSLIFDIWDWRTWKIFEYKSLVNIWKHEPEFAVKIIVCISINLGAANMSCN